MKKFLSLMVGLGLILSTVTPSFSQTSGSKKHGKRGKKGGKKGGTRGGPAK